jgi:site-specific DNA recombinase
VGSPALHPGQRVDDPAPLPLAFLGRTSTAIVQDPVSSMRRQVRSAQEKAPPGSFIAAWYWDIESGGMDLEERGHGSVHERFDVGIPRDGGIADLLTEAGGPNPRFAAVICEDIERSGRDTFNALKLERQLTDAGIPLLAADEPIDLEGMNATTILVRRVKQGVAEWYRFQIKEKAWKGLREHVLDGWNIGPAPYGYTAERIPHPVAVKAAQGRTKTRLILDPPRARVVAQIFTWRTADRLGIPEITDRLNADHDACPPPAAGKGWTNSGVYSILGNPKYTGRMVFGRRRSAGGKRGRRVPPEQWIWSPAETHPAIVTRPTWDTAQRMSQTHATSRNDLAINAHRRPAAPTCCAGGSAAGPANGACTASPAPHPATTQAARMWITPTTCAPTTRPTPPTRRKPPITPPPCRSAKTCC